MTRDPPSKIKRHQGVNHRDQMDAWLDAAPVVRASWDWPAHLRPEPSRSRGIALACPGSSRRCGHSGRRAAMVHGCIRARQLDHQLPGALPFVPQLASATLQVLARRQATVWDDFETPSLADPYEPASVNTYTVTAAVAVLRVRGLHTAVLDLP